MDVDNPDAPLVFEDDKAELEKAQKLKRRIAALETPEEFIDKAFKKEPEDMDIDRQNEGAMTLNSTEEFCRTLGDIPTYGMSGNRDQEAGEIFDYEKKIMLEKQKSRETEQLAPQQKGAWNQVEIVEAPVDILAREHEPILEEEPDVSVGVAGALKLALKKGYIENDNNNNKAGVSARCSYLQAQSYTIEKKFYEDDKFGSKRDRYQGPLSEFKEKDNYKPDVKLEYTDDKGRNLNPKEAFRFLSHKFHGKGSGKNKVDKRLRKMEQDAKLKHMSSTDTPLSTSRLLQDKQKELATPYILLSGGSKALTQ